MSDQFTSQYQDLPEGLYGCVDRIVVRAWLPGCGNGGGSRNWWQSLDGSFGSFTQTGATTDTLCPSGKRA